MCGGGNKTTTTSTQAPNPAAMGYYNQAFGTASNVANTPTSAVPLQGVANLSSEQNAGIGGINQYANAAQPYYQQAATYANNAATPLTAQQIQNYQNPYTQQVVNATEAQFNNQNAQQQQQVLGNAAAQGALGGDRVGVAQANLAGQQQLAQAPVIAGLYSQGYNTATQTALAEQQAQAQGAYSLGNIGAGIQNSGISGAGAQLGAGQLQQQYGPNSQAYYNALYGQQLGQFQLPFQESQLLTGAAGSLGSQMGGTSTTQAPPPNIFSQIAGLGMGAAGLGLAFSDRRLKENVHKVGKTNDGQPIYRYQFKGSPEWHIGLMAQDVEKSHPHAVHEGIGGVKMVDLKSATDDAIGKSYGGALSYDSGGVIPFANQSNLLQIAPMGAAHNTMPSAPQGPNANAATPSIGQQAIQLASLATKGNGANNLKSGIGNLGTGISDAWNGLTNPPTSLAPPGIGSPADASAFSTGDLGGTAGVLGSGLFSRGGTISTGGAVYEPPRDPNGIYVPRGFADGGDTFDQRFGTWPPQADPPADTSFDERETQQLGLGKPVDWGMGQDAPAIPALPPATTVAPASGYNSDDAALPANSTLTAGQAIPGLVPPTTAPDQPSAPGQEKGAFGIPRDAALALASAGFGIAGGASPYAGINIGRGAQQGLESFQQQQKQRLTFEQEAKKLAQQADQFQKSLAQQKELHNAITPYQQAEVALKQRQQALAELQPVTVTDSIGMPHSMVKDPNTGQLIPYEQAVRQNPLLQQQQPGTPAPSGPPGRARTIPVSWDVEPGLEYLAQPTADEIPKTARPEVLQGIDQGLAARVRAVDEGRMPLPTGAAQRMPQNIALMELLSRYDPGFTAQDYASKLATRKDFTAGPTAKNITALNTVMQHVKELDGAAGDLNNWHSGWLPTTGMLNKGTEMLREGQQDPRLSRFNTAANAVANELERAFRGNTTAISGIEEWRKGLNPSMSPEQWQASRGTLMKLLGGRLEAVTDQYNRGMGSAKDPMMMLSPGAAQAYKELQSPQGQQRQQQNAAPPTQRQVGQTVTTSKGTFKWNGSGWDPVQ